jgi:UDP-glucuronate decarboxylase
MNKLANLIIDDCSKIINNKIFNDLNKKTILITGATGLIGHYLIATLDNINKNGINPTMLYVIYQSDPPFYFNDLCTNLNVEFIKGDLTDDIFLKELPKADIIIHAAGYGQPGKFMHDKIKTIELNTKATIATLNKLNPDGKYVFLSTSEVYNGLTTPPFNENQIGTTDPSNERSCYIEGKRCGEAIVNAYNSKGINAKSIRLSLAYGPGTKVDDARVINNFIQKAIINNKIELLDSGNSMRTYLYVLDAVEIIFKILLNGKFNLYNLGGESRTTIINLANLIAENIGVEVFTPENKIGLLGAPSDVFLDMSLFKNEFKFDNFIPLKIGLNKTIQWQKILYLNK